MIAPWEALAQQPDAPSFTPDTVFDAAGYRTGGFAPASWVALYGANFTVGNEVVVPDAGFPISVAGTTVTVTDANGVAHPAGLRFVAQTRLSFLAPADMAIGPAMLTVGNAAGLSGSAQVQIDRVAPGLFAANEVGQGPAVATFLRVLEDGSRTEGLTFITNAIAGTRSNFPIQFGPEQSQLYLSLWGTGFRGTLSAQARIGDVDVPVVAAVAHSQSSGLDQAVLGPIPRSLMDAGVVEIGFTADGVAANPSTISFLEEPSPASAITLDVIATINEIERLIVKRNTLQWVRVAPPSDASRAVTLSAKITTTVGGKEAISGVWQPHWIASGPAEAGAQTTVFSELWPPLPAREMRVSLTRLLHDSQGRPIPVRGDVRIVEAPTAGNDFTLILEFDDSANSGGGGLPVRLLIEPLP